MKTLNEYLSFPYRMEIIEDQEEGGYLAFYPDLPGCISSGETLEAAVTNVQAAKREWLIAAIESDIEILEPSKLEYSGQFKLRIPKSLHRLLSEHSRQEGISMNQYCLYLLSRNDAIHTTK